MTITRRRTIIAQPCGTSCDVFIILWGDVVQRRVTSYDLARHPTIPYDAWNRSQFLNITKTPKMTPDGCDVVQRRTITHDSPRWSAFTEKVVVWRRKGRCDRGLSRKEDKLIQANKLGSLNSPANTVLRLTNSVLYIWWLGEISNKI